MDINFPRWVRDCVEAECRKNMEDIDGATNRSLACLRKNPEFDSLIESFIWNSVRDLVHDFRHKNNVEIKRQTGQYNTVPKVQPGKSESVQSAYADVFDFCIAGKTLGSMTGAELPIVALNERTSSEGHLRNARICEALAPLVAENQTVRESVTAKKLRQIIDQSTAKGKKAG